MSLPRISLEVKDHIAPEDLKKITDGLDAHAQSNIGVTCQPLNIIAKNETGKTIGGLTGFVAGKSFMVNFLWVDETQRKSGAGRDLMNKAESAAKEKGCSHIRVDTYAYQAPEFYKKLNYHLTATIRNFYEGQDRLFFQKDIK